MFKTSFQFIHRQQLRSPNNMQNEKTPLNLEHAYGNYFGARQTYIGINNTRADNCAGTIVHNHSPTFCSTSPNRAQKLNSQNIPQPNLAISSPRRSIHVEDPRLLDPLTFAQQPNLLADPAAYRTTYRAPSLRTNGRSLSARDSQEEFQLEKMNGGKWFVCGWINKHF